MHSRLALGTVQFGGPYGIANHRGQVSRQDAADILALAAAAGLNTLDTAIAYGQAEDTLGEVGVPQWHVVSKLPAIPECQGDVSCWVYESVADLLQRLRIPRLRGLLLHRSQDLAGPHGEALHQALMALKTRGMVEKIGVSIYAPEELDVLWSRIPLDLVQAPLSIVDRRLATSGWLKRLSDAGTEVHVRSVFLQGLLLMESSRRPAQFSRWQTLWEAWDRWLDSHALTPLQACLGFALSHSTVDRVVVGVDNVTQLQEILAAVGAAPVVPLDALASEDLDLINPSRWNIS